MAIRRRLPASAVRNVGSVSRSATSRAVVEAAGTPGHTLDMASQIPISRHHRTARRQNVLRIHLLLDHFGDLLLQRAQDPLLDGEEPRVMLTARPGDRDGILPLD